MKILSAAQLKLLDSYTVENNNITSIDLMERAALHCVKWIEERYDKKNKFQLFCGLGNNGGDGLAIARNLLEKNYQVEVFVIKHSDKYSENFIINFDRLKAIKNDKLILCEITSFDQLNGILNLTTESVLIDAIFGNGLNKTVGGFVAEIISFINTILLPVISIDIPSGLYCDKLNEATDPIIRANYTITFQFPKLSFMFVESSRYIGVFTILDIGLNSGFLSQISTSNFFITKTDILSFMKVRNRISHKGNFGHALIVSGSYGNMGAAVLSSKACLRVGVGLLTVHVPKRGVNVIQNSVHEAMVSIDNEEAFVANNIRLEKYNAIGVGPGLGMEKQTQNALKLIIQNTHVPVVFDADAINILAENKTWLSFIKPDSIFTPHPKEFERLVGKSRNSEERLILQKNFSIKYSSYVVFKGAHTTISCPNGDVFFNSTGNPGMATAGSGDVLTGIITSLLAQGYTSLQSSIFGVYLHGLSGDFASQEKSEESIIASDIVENISEGFKFLWSNKE